MISEAIARRFDRAEAEATLPLVRRIVADIQADDRRLQAVLPELKNARARGADGESPELEILRRRVAEITTRFETCLGELARVGCVYRGSTGHVDFRGELDGHPVFYCWAPGEDEVAHFHSLGAHCRMRESVTVAAGPGAGPAPGSP